jgi:hypothetical protein
MRQLSRFASRRPMPSTDTMPFASKLAAASALCLLALAAAACSSSTDGSGAGNTGPSSTSASSSSTGSSSPTAAASAFYMDLAKSDFSGACGFVVPGEDGACISNFQGASFAITDPGVGKDFVDGNQALVVLTSTKACFGTGGSSSTTSCGSNTNPSAGLPTSDADFATAEQSASNSNFTTLPCSEVGGAWYVQIVSAGVGTTGAGAPSSTGNTGTTAPGNTGNTGNTTTTS